MSEPSIVSSPIDPFFEFVPDGEWNACVGLQGSDVNYVDGYMEAARELAAAVIDKRLIASRDTLAMPILYNCRHAIELSLKFAIERLYRIGMLATEHPVNHDILSHWHHLRDGGIGDAKLVQLIAELEPFVTSLAGIDEDGQQLRYARTREGAQSLGGIAVINLPLIRHSIDQLSAILDHIKYRVFDLEEERATGTHTGECSRSDLEEIARIVGPHATWRDASFDEKKRLVMDRFGLSSRKFSAALGTIRASRPLAALVELETDLAYVSDEKAIGALELWAKAHPIRKENPKELGTDYFNRDRRRMKEHAHAMQELIGGIQALLSLEELSDLETLFYIGRDGVSGEHYQEKLTNTIAAQRLADPYGTIHHIMSKSNLLDCVCTGAVAAGRPSLSEKLKLIRRPEEQSVGVEDAHLD